MENSKETFEIIDNLEDYIGDKLLLKDNEKSRNYNFL